MNNLKHYQMKITISLTVEIKSFAKKFKKKFKKLTSGNYLITLAVTSIAIWLFPTHFQ